MDSKPVLTIEHRTVSNIKLPAQWAKLMRRLMTLADGQHQIVLNVQSGQVEEWALLVRHKQEK
jgi:hypothetical protein